MRRLVALLTALLLLVGTAACGGDGDDDAGEDPHPTTPAEAAGGDGEDDDASSVTVELLDAGQEPRQALRLDPPADCEQRVTQSQAISQEVVSGSIDGVPIPAEQLAQVTADAGDSGTEFDATYRCEELDDDRIAVITRYDEARSIGTQPAAVDDMLESFKGAEGRVVYDAQGRVLDVEPPDIDIPDDVLGPAFSKAMDEMLDGLGSTIEQSANPFPEEPVGIGARWRVTADIDVVGLRSRSITEYTLTRIDDGVIEADVTLSNEFLPGEMDFPGMPAGAAEITDGSMSGTGTTRWELGGVVAYFDQVLDGTMSMRISAEGQAIEMSMRQHQELSLQPR